MSGSKTKENWGPADEEFERAMAEVAARVERDYEEERLLTTGAEQAEQADREQMALDSAATAREMERLVDDKEAASTIPFKIIKVSKSHFNQWCFETVYSRFQKNFWADCHYEVEEISVSFNFVSRRDQCIDN